MGRAFGINKTLDYAGMGTLKTFDDPRFSLGRTPQPKQPVSQDLPKGLH